MKKVLNILGIVLKILGVIFILYIVFKIIISSHFNNKSFVPKNYEETVETKGEIEAKYLKHGKYEIQYFENLAMSDFKRYEIYYPKNIEEEKKYPAVIFVNGTGVIGLKFKALQEHMASWGFITIATDEENSWHGFSTEMSYRYLEKLNNNKLEDIEGYNNELYGHVDLDNVGITGHSQGGVGVFNAVNEQKNGNKYKTIVAISPTNKELATALDWVYDASKINKPTLLISGEGGGDDWVVTREGLEAIYNDLSGTKVMMRIKNTAHGETLYKADGYVTAWFMYYLQGDNEAAKAFIGENPEILRNDKYQDQQIDLKNE